MTPQTGASTPAKAGASTSAVPVPTSVQEGTPIEPVTQTLSLVSELDAYILERQKGQPKTLEEVVEVSERRRAQLRHRLVLPEYFERQSHDNAESSGKFIFRWVSKRKRAIDEALNQRGWVLVNRTYFADAPKHLFSANGGIEEGDNILMFMPAKKALELRQRPGELSRERINASVTVDRENPNYVLMTGKPDDPAYYKPKLSKSDEADVAVETGAVV